MPKRDRLADLEDTCHLMNVDPDGIMAQIVNAIRENRRQQRGLQVHLIIAQALILLLFALRIGGCP